MRLVFLAIVDWINCAFVLMDTNFIYYPLYKRRAQHFIMRKPFYK